MKREDRATISVHIQTKAEIDAIGKRGETFDDIIKRLLACYQKRCETVNVPGEAWRRY
jgi:transcriptional regulator